MKILITICGRAGSKGIPGKNIKILNGKPLLGYTIEIAQIIAKKYKAKISLSTNDPEIKKVAESYNLFSDYVRSNSLSTDFVGKIDTIKDLIFYEEFLISEKYDYILDLDITSPLRTLDDIEKSFDLMIKNPNAESLFSVNNAQRNPYFNMVELNSDGFYSLVKKVNKDEVLSRQGAPKVFDLNASFYWYKRSFFDLNIKLSVDIKT